MSFQRTLHPDQELAGYDVIHSAGGYPRIVEVKPTLPDYSALTRAVQQQAIDQKLRSLRKRNGQKTGRRV